MTLTNAPMNSQGMLSLFCQKRENWHTYTALLCCRSPNGNSISTSTTGRLTPGNGLEPQRIEGRTTREKATKAAPEEDILYPKGPISGLPEEFESRRERFAELDDLQAGWSLELRKRRAGSVVEAVFFSPSGVIHE